MEDRMAKAQASVEELVAMIQRGELRLPEMQRRYVWRSTRVRDLLDSLYRGYPSGAILIWETDEEVPLQPFAVGQQVAPFASKRLLLDGQQRLTSLSAIIRGEPVTVRGKTRPVELLFNLDHPDELSVVTEVEDAAEGPDDDDTPEDAEDSTEEELQAQLQARFSRMAFVVATKALEQQPNWVKVTEVFKSDQDAPFMRKAGVLGFDDPRYERYSQRLRKLRGIRKYEYRMDILERTLSYEEVTEIFVRVNSLGAKLRSSDLALAQITAKWRGALEVFQSFERRCADLGFPVELGIHLKNLVAFATGQSRFQAVGTMSPERLRSAWEQCVPGMEFAINFLRSNALIDNLALLSSPFPLIVVGFLGHQRSYQLMPSEADWLRYWLLVANAKGRFSRGSSETLLDQDLAVLRQGGTARDLVERLRTQVGRLDFAPDELEGRNQRSALFKTMFLAFRASGAKDWVSQLAIDLDHSGAQHRLQFHHFHPKGSLKGHVSPREADDIANLTFISGRTNRSISDKSPGLYLPEIMGRIGQAAFEAQCIPLDPGLHRPEHYREFLVARRQLICARLNEFVRPPAA